MYKNYFYYVKRKETESTETKATHAYKRSARKVTDTHKNANLYTVSTLNPAPTLIPQPKYFLVHLSSKMAGGP